MTSPGASASFTTRGLKKPVGPRKICRLASGVSPGRVQKQRSIKKLDSRLTAPRRPICEPESSPQILDELVSTLCKKKKILIIAGAGISVSAGMPTFTGSNSTNQSLLQRDLLDASVYNNDSHTKSFHKMIRAAAESAATAAPTPFHYFIAELARKGRLLRLYTQNIDDLETHLELLATVRPLPQNGPWPKTIQLHGSLGTAVCASCGSVFALEPQRFDGPSPPDCLKCKAADAARLVAGKRSHGIGRLRPRVALYNEVVADSEAIGTVMQADLRKRPDAVVVVGTSLRIPGIQKFAREVCTVVRKRRNGLTVWVNPAEEPWKTKGMWDIVLRGTSDTVAAAAGISRG